MTLQRPEHLKISTGQLHLPVYFPSVSSVKTTLPPIEYVRALNALSSVNKQYLVSAFDLVRTDAEQRSQIQGELKKARDNGVIVLMDSGNYESYWKVPMPGWSQDEFHSALRDFSCDLAFGFDEQRPPADTGQHLKILNERYVKDRAAAGNALLVPIIHGNKESLPNICTQFAQTQCLQMIAVPERCLGLGIFERASTVSAIRQQLNESGHYVGLHLLGTGNPLSLAIYAISGADSFDGLEWCQTVVDHETSLLHHFSQGDFFRGQTRWGDEELAFQLRNLAHNIEFYSDWMRRMVEAFRSGAQTEFCRANFPERIYSMCRNELGWELA